MKRVFDILFSLIALIIFLPLFVIIAILVKLDSKGKIFFRQKRVGKNSKEFYLLKFRTMREGSEATGMLTIGDKDSRITRIGFYLRKYKLDELPQFINVLKGDMSIVGPRPEVKKYTDLYTEEQRKILSVKPGITDIASVQFSDESKILLQYSNPEEAYVRKIMPEKLSLSLRYLEKRNLLTDIIIMVKTLRKIFSPMHLENVLLALLVFSLPLYERASAWLAAAVVVYRFFNKKIISYIRSSANVLTVLLAAYYLAHLAGTFYSSNLSYAFFDLQIKLPFLVFPLFLSGPLKKPEAFTRLKNYFIAGCTLASLLCLIAAMVSFSENRDPFDFFYIAYSRFLHVTYFSMYLNLCVLFLIEDLIHREKKYSGLKLALLIFLIINIILLSARTALFTCFLTATVYSVTLSTQRGMLKDTYKLIIFLIIVLVATGIFFNKVYNRFAEVNELIQNKGAEKNSGTPKKEEDYNSVSIRMELWKDSWELIRKNIWFGVGTGDIKDVLAKKYTEEKFYFGAEKKFNPHNQFLHTAVALGLTGLIVLVLMLAIPAVKAIKSKNYLYVFFCGIVFLNSLTESILEVQKGVLFFCIFSILLYNFHNSKTEFLQREISVS